MGEVSRGDLMPLRDISRLACSRGDSGDRCGTAEYALVARVGLRWGEMSRARPSVVAAGLGESERNAAELAVDCN